jgi:hypothetical protein
LELNELARKLLFIYEYLGNDWSGYDEELTEDDFAVTLAAMVDYLDGLDDPSTVELPGARLMVVRDESNSYHLWTRIGEIDVDSIA